MQIFKHSCGALYSDRAYRALEVTPNGHRVCKRCLGLLLDRSAVDGDELMERRGEELADAEHVVSLARERYNEILRVMMDGGDDRG